jgi:hypothetical protein
VRKYAGANEKIMKSSVRSSIALACFVLTMSACGHQAVLPDTTGKGDPDLYFVRGYRFDRDPCKLTGETEFTNQFLDDAADLVTCLTTYKGTAEFIKTTGASVVTQTKSYTLYSVPRR